jgi:hypothetical protein
MTPRQVQRLYDKSQKRILAARPLRTLPPRPKRTAIIYRRLPVGNQERERTHCPLQPHLSRTNWHLELVVPSHRPQDLTPQPRWCKVVVYPQSVLHRTLNPARARTRESERQDKIAATVTATMVSRAGNRSGVEQNNPSNAWGGVFKDTHTHTPFYLCR